MTIYTHDSTMIIDMFRKKMETYILCVPYVKYKYNWTDFNKNFDQSIKTYVIS